MDYIKDCIGNKVHIGDEVLYIPYDGGNVIKECISTVTKFTKYGVATTKYKSITRFVKVIREQD